MAAEDVIYFLFRTQLSPRANSPALIPPEPISEPPPQLKTRRIFAPCRIAPDHSAIRVSNQRSEHFSETIIEQRNPRSNHGQQKWWGNEQSRRFHGSLPLESEHGPVDSCSSAPGVA